MERTGGMLVCILIVLIDIVAGLIGIQAQIIQNKSTHLRKLVFGCKEPVHQAFILGVTAAVLLSLAHGIAIVFGGCPFVFSMDKSKRSSRNKKMAFVVLILSWFIFLGGLVMLIIAAIDNSPGARLPCRISQLHFLSNGGILCFIHGAFCVAYFVLATASMEETERKN
ncbi:uncharacterized protein LOC120267797 isoform X1 [Dioscorea cayenensis subsp. rotundata]|uniref:Uncharacterized protein LOC120267797 isoform X1 n=1 Tax=Dioscorea cayennensis subsp. rotundata TaxID=55577 RepID=A0AB40BVB9_DIOCR|nr:uncharacterized protein LOC120267797 isoform X1 [Dioscorea cayenensis subsp. rotundata]